MKQGKYTSPRKRRRINWIAILFWVLILAILVAGIILLSRACDSLDQYNEDPSAETTLSHTNTPGSTPTKPSAAPATDPSQEVTLPEETEPPTEETIPPTEETIPTTVPEESTEPFLPDETLPKNQQILSVAQSLLDKPSAKPGEAGVGPDSFDASGLVYYCLSQCDIPSGRVFSEQFALGTPVAQEDLVPGDIVFFYQVTEGQPEYAGIYIGEGNFIAVGDANGRVEIKNMTYNTYFADRFIGARRFGD